MAVSITQRYTDPTTGLEKTKTVTVDIRRSRLDSTVSDAETFVLRGSSSGNDDVDIDVSSIVQDILDGKPSRAQDSKSESYLTAPTASGQTIVSVFDASKFAVGDVVALKNNYDDTGTNVDYAVVSAINGSALTLSTDDSGTGLGKAFIENAVVQNLVSEHWGASTGLGGSLGEKAQLERPAPVTDLAISDAAGNSVDVSFIESKSAGVVSVYDIYVSRATLFTGIPANRKAIYSDVVYGSGKFNVTQYNEADNVAYSLGSAQKVHIYVVPKTGSGQFDVDEGPAVEKIHTLD
jgi:hypothetical protein